MLEPTCLDNAIQQWRKSKVRKDLPEEVRLTGAIEAYERQKLALEVRGVLEKPSTTADDVKALFDKGKRAELPSGSYVHIDAVTESIGFLTHLVERVDRFAKTYLRHFRNADQRAVELKEELELAVSDEDKGAWRFWSKKSRELAYKNADLLKENEALRQEINSLKAASAKSKA